MSKDSIFRIGLVGALLLIGVVLLISLFKAPTVIDTSKTSPKLGGSTQSYWCVNGLCTTVLNGALGGKASTTILSIQNPTGVTSTLDYLTLTDITAATNTNTFLCTTSTTVYAPANMSGTILSSDSVASSTNFGVIENGIAAGYSIDGYGGGSVAKITVGPTNYIICKANANATGLFVTSTNSFAGTYELRFLSHANAVQ